MDNTFFSRLGKAQKAETQFPKNLKSWVREGEIKEGWRRARAVNL